MAPEVWDCIVVGGGIVGSWTGYHLADQGQRVLMLDQFMLPTSRGSSGGQSRIIRMLYPEQYYMAMMPEAFQQWEKLAKDSNTKLFVNTKILLMQEEKDSGMIDESRANMEAHKLPYTLLSPGELAKNYPQLHFNQYRGLLDHKAGVLLNSRCLKAIQGEFQKKGGRIQDGEKVTEIIPGSTVKVITSARTYSAKKVVLAAGPWSQEILSQLGVNAPLKTMPGLNVYFKEKDPSNPQYGVAQGYPITYHFLYKQPGAYRFVCTFPSEEYPGMVKMITRGEPPPYYCPPDERDARGSEELVRILTQYVKDHLPGLDPTPRILEPCVYTMTPDRDYIIDHHPKYSNIVIGAGFSGHGYMRAPVIGRLMMELAMDKRPTRDISLYRLNKNYLNSKL